MSTARDTWISAHPYLQQLARFEEALDQATADAPAAPAPAWDAYDADFRLGVPLLRSATARVEVRAPAAEALGRLAERVTEAKLPESLAGSAHALREHLRRSPGARAAVIGWALDGEGEAPPQPGFARFLAWHALAQVLAPVVEEFARRRDENAWYRGYCPTCGASPGMAQLVESPTGKERLLACPCCRTRWKFKRIACPFCENEAPTKIDVLELEDEQRLRVDSCQDCKGYVKTYVGVGDEALFLADWTTLHLDVLAKQRGLERKGASLYAL